MKLAEGRCEYESIFVIDHYLTGDKYYCMRKEKSLSLREVARRMGISAAYLSDLERAKRNWNEKLAERYEIALGEASTSL